MALDNFSSDCFMSEELMHKMGIRGQKGSITLSTLEGINRKHATNVVNNLEVCDLEENYFKTIPVTYSRELWPFSKKDVPKEADFESFAHLNGLPMQYLDEPIGLMVGANMPSLLKPLEVVHGEEDQPYATLHSLGWAVCGPLKYSRDQKSTCHRITVESSSIDNQIKGFF